MAKYGLDIVAPRADLPANNRYYRAYPGLEYSVPVGVFGGLKPFTFSLLNAPAGMTIDSTTGEIVWPNPQSTATGIIVRVRDREGTVVEETWTVTVSATDFLFIDAVNGNNSWNGAAPAFVSGSTGPIQTVSQMRNIDVGTTIWVFRGGASHIYNLNGTTGNPVDFEYNAGGGVGNGVMWINYPGETPKFDLQHVPPSTTDAPYPRLFGPYIYVAGFEFYGDRTKSIEAAPSEANAQTTFYRCSFHTGGPGEVGSNAGFIMTPSNGLSFAQFGTCIVNCQFGAAAHNCLKLYSIEKLVIDRCASTHNGGLELKQFINGFSVRSSTWLNHDNDGQGGGVAIGGNLNDNEGAIKTNGEICFCLIQSSVAHGIQLGVDRVNSPGVVEIHHCTIIDRIRIENLNTADGPYRLEDCVVVNADGAGSPYPFVDDVNILDASRFIGNISSNPELSPTGVENLAGSSSDNIVDSAGKLTGSYRGLFLGLKGYELAEAVPPLLVKARAGGHL